VERLKATLLRDINRLDPNTTINRIVRGVKIVYEEMGANGILVNVKNTLSSFINIIIAIRTAGRSNCYGIYFEKPHSNIKNIERIYTLSRFNLSRLDIKHVYKYVIKNMPDLGFSRRLSKITKHEIENDIELLVLRFYAKKNNYLLCGDLDRTRWLTGAFSRYLTGSVDILPLTSVYKTQLKLIAKRLRIAHLAKNAEEPREWLEFKREIGIENIPDEKIDAILYGFDNNWTIKQIADDLEIDEDIIRKIRTVVDSTDIIRHLPLTL